MSPMIKYLIVAGALVMTPSVYAGGGKCIDKGEVIGIKVGYTEGYTGGPDEGSAITFKYFESSTGINKWIPISHLHNLNDYDKGTAFLSLLRTAMLTGMKIEAYDHAGTYCDDIDEIRLIN